MTIRTWHDLIRKYFPDADDKRCEFILWEKTAFPLVPVETIERQLQEYAEEVKKCQSIYQTYQTKRK